MAWPFKKILEISNLDIMVTRIQTFFEYLGKLFKNWHQRPGFVASQLERFVESL